VLVTINKQEGGSSFAAALLILFILLAITARATAANSAAGPATGRESLYQINSHGFHVGEMKTLFQPLTLDGRLMVRFRATTEIDANFLFFSRQSVSRADALVGKNGTIEFHHSYQGDGEAREVAATFSDTGVRLDVREGGKLRTVVFPRGRYDYTTMDCAEMSLTREGEQRVIRLLDLEHVRVVSRNYRWEKSEDIPIGGRNINCRVIDFEDRDTRGRRWITQDEKGIIIVREEGCGESGSYVLKLTGLIDK
jgi:archaeosine-15-forming tRNA-guanine transglycosylase